MDEPTMSSEDISGTANGGHGKCANPDCQETGKLKCSGCSSVYYCSQQCQKKHWNLHKSSCKPPQKPASNSSSPTPVSPVNLKAQQDPAAPLQALKAEIQKNFAKGDFENAIKKSEEALRVAKDLPPLVAASETIQLHINLSTAFIHTNRLEEAETHADLAVRTAETAVSQRPGQPQPIEVLSIAFGSRALAHVSNNKVDTALEAAQRSLTLAESIYPKNDPRFHKSLRTLGMILDKKGDIVNASVQLVKAYTIICLASGPQAPEAQILTEDLVGIYSRRGDFENAEKYARKNYQALKDKQKDFKGVEIAIIADAATRLAGTLMRKNEFKAAEGFVKEALSIREKAEVAQMNPLGVAYSLAQLVSLHEQMNQVTEESEAMVMKALEIFTRIKGPNSQEVANSLQQLKNVKLKRKSTSAASSDGPTASGGGVTVEDVDDDEEDNKNSNHSNSNNSSNAVASSSSSAKKKNPPASPGRAALNDSGDRVTAEDQRKIDSLNPNDGVIRMQLAGMMFEQKKFAVAEVLLSQAFDIFLRTHGPEHEHTKAAKQNLTLVRNNRLNQLWMQIVTEEVVKKMEEMKISDPSDEPNSPKPSSGSQKNKQNNKGEEALGEEALGEVGSGGEYSKLISGAGRSGNDSELTLEERLFLQSVEKEKPSSGCLIC